jgi:hypothetical protein
MKLLHLILLLSPLFLLLTILHLNHSPCQSSPVDEEDNDDQQESTPRTNEEEEEAEEEQEVEEERKNRGKNETEYEFHKDILADCAASTIQVVSDEWTRRGETPPNCTFPFIYQGRIYYECIDLHWGGNYWCANSCDFIKYRNHRGKCAITQNKQGFMGTGFSLSFLNVFIALLMTTAFVIAIMLCLVEVRNRRSGRRVEDSTFHIPGVNPSFNIGGAQSGSVATI